jgi:hypothetical protein
MLSLRFSGLFLLRFADRVFSALLLNEPPRSTRESLKAALGPTDLTVDHVSETDHEGDQVGPRERSQPPIWRPMLSALSSAKRS